MAQKVSSPNQFCQYSFSIQQNPLKTDFFFLLQNVPVQEKHSSTEMNNYLHVNQAVYFVIYQFVCFTTCRRRLKKPRKAEFNKLESKNCSFFFFNKLSYSHCSSTHTISLQTTLTYFSLSLNLYSVLCLDPGVAACRHTLEIKLEHKCR